MTWSLTSPSVSVKPLLCLGNSSGLHCCNDVGNAAEDRQRARGHQSPVSSSTWTNATTPVKRPDINSAMRISPNCGPDNEEYLCNKHAAEG